MLTEPDQLRFDSLGLAWLPYLGFRAQETGFCSALVRPFVHDVGPRRSWRGTLRGVRIVLLYWG